MSNKIKQLNYNNNNNKLHFNESFKSTPEKKKPETNNDIADTDAIIENEIPSCCNQCCGFNCWWEPSPGSCKSMEFCSVSNLHGLKYVGQSPGHFVERVLWSIFFICGVAASFWFIRDVWEKFVYSPVTVTFTEDGIHIDEIPFPAITVCNVNSIRKSIVNNYQNKVINGTKLGLSHEEIHEYKDKLVYVQHVCDATSTSFSSKFNFSESSRRVADAISLALKDEHGHEHKSNTKLNVIDFLSEAAQPCLEMAYLCLWQSKKFNCTDLFQRVVTDYGQCCTFNMIPEKLLFHKERGILKYLKQELVDEWQKAPFDADSLIEKGVKERDEQDVLRLKHKSNHPRRVRNSGLSSGLSVVLNPDLNEHFCTAADSVGFQVSVHLPIEIPHIAEYGDAIDQNTEAYVKIRSDVILADPAIRSLDIEKRNCYFTGEFTLAYFTTYTGQNCLDECYANLTFKICNCSRYYMPRDEGRPLCTHDQIACALRLEDNFATTTTDLFCSQCLITCNDINYIVEVTTRPLRNEIDIWDHPTENRSHWQKQNLSMVHFYFGETVAYPKIRERLFGVTDLLASVGSLLGLFLGFSALSGLEFLYSVCTKIGGVIIRLFKLKQFCRNRNWSIIDSRPSTVESTRSRVTTVGRYIKNPRRLGTNFYPGELNSRNTTNNYY